MSSDANVTRREAQATSGTRPRGTHEIDRLDLLLTLLAASLVVLTIMVVAEPTLSPVVLNARLDLVIEVIASLVAAGVAGLAWIRFRERPEPATILLSSAFVVLGTSSALAAAVIVLRVEPSFGMDRAMAGQAPLYAWLSVRAIAGLLILWSAVATLRGGPEIRRPGLVLAVAALGTLGLWAGFEIAGPNLPPLIDAEGIRQLASDPLVPGVLPGLTLALVGAQIGVAVVFSLAALLYREAYRRDRRPPTAVLTGGLLVAAFSNLQYALYPAGYAALTTMGDWLRFVFYALLLFVVAAEAGADLRALRQANADLERLRDAEVARAALEERARLAREVHDGLAQDLWFAKLKHGRLLARHELDGEGRSLAEEVADAIDSALTEARQAVWAFRFDPTTEAGSFTDVVATFVEDFGDRFGLRVEFRLDDPFPILPSRAQAELLRIVQEALNNVRKHADATDVRVHMASDGGVVRVSVNDNGRGFDPASLGDGGVGIPIMRERAGLIGGILHIESEPGTGTRVEAEVSLP